MLIIKILIMNDILEIVFSLELIHLFVYFIQCLYSFKRLEVYSSPLFLLMTNIVFTVNHLVTLYFYTFTICFNHTLDVFNLLIQGYYNLLSVLITSFLSYPTCLICIFGLGISLFFINEILKTLLKYNNHKIIKKNNAI